MRQWENVIHCLHSYCPGCGISADQQIVSICLWGSEFCLLRKYPVAFPCDLSKAGSISEGSKVKAAEKRVIFWGFLGACCGFLTSFLKCDACPTHSLQLTKVECCAVLRTIHSKRRFYSESEKEFACNAVGGMQKGIYERNLKALKLRLFSPGLEAEGQFELSCHLLFHFFRFFTLLYPLSSHVSRTTLSSERKREQK